MPVEPADQRSIQGAQRWESSGPASISRRELVVIGQGTAAIEAARTADRLGARVTLVPWPPPVGDAQFDPWGLGHALRLAARKIYEITSADPPARLTEGDPSTRLLAILEQARQGQFGSSGANAVEDLARGAVEVRLGRPTFTGPNRLAVEGRELRFRRAIVAAGSVAVAPAIGGAEESRYLTEETLVRLNELPRRLAIFGAGPDACEWAQVFRRFGSDVHLISSEPSILAGEDPEAVAFIEAQFSNEQIRLHLSCEELSLEKTGSRKAVVIGRGVWKEKLLVDQVLLCGPKRPNVAGLGLDAAGVAHTDSGILVSEHMQTTNPRIFAAGEVCGAEFAHRQAAWASAHVSARNAVCLLPLRALYRRLDRQLIGRCLYTDPEVIQVGLAPREASARLSGIDVYREDVCAAESLVREGSPRGFVTVVVHRRTGRIVGVTAVARAADELVAPLVLLMSRKLSLAALAGVTACYPSRLEVLQRIAERYLAEGRSRLGTGWMEKWRAWRVRFGGKTEGNAEG